MMLKNLLSLILTLAMIFTIASFSDAAPKHVKPLIGAQISVLEEENWKNCEEYFYKLRDMGYNTIILRVFHNRKDRFHNLVKKLNRKQNREGVYFNTEQAPVILDILTPACESAHRAGLKIFAWMTTLRANYAHKSSPQVLSYDETNGSIKKEENLLEPSAPENIDFLKKLFLDLAAYPIDGILLQDDLMLRDNQGFGQISGSIIPEPKNLYQFSGKNQTRISAYKPLFYHWRRQQALTLQHLANTIFSTCRSLKPTLICTQNVHYELLYNNDWGRDWFACTKVSLNASKADYLMIMAYQERIRRELELVTEKELSSTMIKIFENELTDKKERLIFKFETPAPTGSHEQKLKLITTLQTTIRNARKKGWQDLILTPCNNRDTAACLLVQ
ncbi:MAG: poly-beta-1,6-N-acetyl-D-glucosamine N-deacetylase PgaB [Pseudomonadota bacterium]|nr:poly-beta-1,6-N-acetyl-D-glucosamine N-deacetylase PgaB [Pseudomonadota bacterium]